MSQLNEETQQCGQAHDADAIHSTRENEVSGENVSLTEVEAILAQAPGILECAVLGRPDPVRDTVPVAYVVPRDREHPPARQRPRRVGLTQPGVRRPPARLAPDRRVAQDQRGQGAPVQAVTGSNGVTWPASAPATRR